MKLLSRTDKPETFPEDHPVASNNELNGLLGKGSTFEGKLSFEGTVHLNGTFTGEIHSTGTLIVGDTARVQGEIHVGTLIINGEVSGQIHASQLIEMHTPARVRGSVAAPTLVIDRGVFFEGTSKMEKADAPKAAPAPITPPLKQKLAG